MRELDEPTVDKVSSLRWLTDGRIEAKTEALIIAAQDGIVRTNAYRYHVERAAVSDRCRVCKEHEESVGHVLSACPRYRFTLYKERHDAIVYAVVRGLCSI